MRVTIQDYPVHAKYFYILYYEDITEPLLLHCYFINRVAAKRALEMNIPSKKRKYARVLRGNKLKKFFVAYDMKKPVYRFSKYQFPQFEPTSQEKKTYRTIMRRRLRRMGLLSIVNPKLNIKKKPPVIKAIENQQKVAKSPNTEARVFQIQRESKGYYYIILSKKLSGKKGYLFNIECLRYNPKTGKLKEMTINTKRTDILIPYLLRDLIKLIDEKIETGKVRVSHYTRFGYPGFAKGT